MNDPTHSTTGVDLPGEAQTEVAPDMLAELGPLAYGLFAVSQSGPLAEVRTLDHSRAAQLPAQAVRSTEQDEARSEALLDELGALDL